MRTVQAVCAGEDVRQLTLPLRCPQTAFMLGPREDDHQTGRRADQVCGTDLFKELASLAHRLETTAHVSGNEKKKDTRAVTSEERGRKRLRVLRPRGIVEPQQWRACRAPCAIPSD